MDTTSDLYWRIKNANDDMNLGFSKSINSNTSSTTSNASLSPPPGFAASSSSSSSFSTNHNDNNVTNNGSSSGGGTLAFDSMSHAKLSPSALDPNGFSSSFILPRFAKGGPAGAFGYDLAIAEPESAQIRLDDYTTSRSSSFSSSFYRPPSTSITPPLLSSITKVVEPITLAVPDSSALVTATYPSAVTPTTTGGPVYAPYGSSIVSINPSAPTYKLSQVLTSIPTPSAIYPPPEPFNPSALSLPVPPPPGTSTNFAGLYSSSGFDLVSVLARVAARPNPTLMIGPVDTSCAFLVVDARKFDMPIVFVSGKFEDMTGYTSTEIIGRNCRFLQSPDADTVQGLPRKYTDGAATWHMKTHITAGKESQSSLINYKKGGQPFINLVTIVPIAWDSDEIAYYVGFQCDLVAQPAAILDRMKDGSYVVNYSLLTSNSIPKTVALSTLEQQQSYDDESWSTDPTLILNNVPFEPLDTTSIASPANSTTSSSAASLYRSTSTSTGGAGFNPLSPATMSTVTNTTSNQNQNQNYNRDLVPKLDVEMEIGNEKTVCEILERLSNGGTGAFGGVDAGERKKLNKMCLDNSDDFIHVLSLKGSMLYCSPSAAKVLEYEPSELVGKTLQTLCHPSDVIPVLRELKDAGSVAHPTVSLLYRIRRKHSGYIWMEASGKLHVEPGKGRKCVILVGRPREVYKMSWGNLRRAGGVGEVEFWSKLSHEGMVLSATSNVQNVLGFSMAEMVGTSLFQLVKTEFVPEIRAALASCAEGKAVSVRYKTKTRRGYVDVVTRFYPREVDSLDNEFAVPSLNTAPTHVSIIAQTNEVNSEDRKNRSYFRQQAPTYISSGDGNSIESDDSDHEDESIDRSALCDDFKKLSHPSLVSDNVFDELDETRCTSWQYELHALTNANTRLKKEKNRLLALRNLKRKAQTAELGDRDGSE